MPDNIPDENDGVPQSTTENEPTLSPSSTELIQTPLPPPRVLAEYNKIVPDAAERLLRMAERQAEHRMEMDRSAVRRSNWGLAAGFTVALAGLGGACELILRGHDVTGTIIGGLDFVSLAATFVYGSLNQKTRNEIQPRRGTPKRRTSLPAKRRK